MKIEGNYTQDGYALIRQMVPAEVAQAFLTQIRKVLKTDVIDLRGAPRIELLNRPSLDIYSQQLPFMRTFLWGLTPAMETVAGMPLLPTYCYFRIYQAGDVCRVHADRPACEHSLSLTIGLSDSRPWPLEVGRELNHDGRPPYDDDFGDEPFASLAMMPGDGVAYRGVDRRHGRISANPNRWSAHLFCHWIDPDGPHAAEAFDRRELVDEVDFTFLQDTVPA